MTATTRLNDLGQTVSEVAGQPGRVLTGRPERVEIARPADPFATIPGAYDDYTPPTTKPVAPTPAADPTHVHSPAGWNANTASDDETTGVCEGTSGCSRAITRTGYDRWDANTTRSTPPAAPVRVVTRTRVVDSPSYAWDNSDQAAYEEIGAAFYSLHRPELDAAAHELIRQPLIAEWRKAGRLARLVDGREFTAVTDTPAEFVPDEQRWTVWQAAANQLTGEELVFAAGLVDEYRDFSDRDY